MGRKWNLHIAKNGVVSTNNYLFLKNQLDQREKELQDELNEHIKLKSELSRLRIAFSDASREKTEA
jgi:hypothetical protein